MDEEDFPGTILLGLRAGITVTDYVAVKILTDLTTQKHEIAGAHDGRKIVVQILFGVGLFGVKGSQSGMHHRSVSHTVRHGSVGLRHAV